MQFAGVNKILHDRPKNLFEFEDPSINSYGDVEAQTFV